jgi:hypothetical protein
MTLNRREAISLVTGLPLALAISPEEAAAAATQVAQSTPYALRFFTPREYATVVALSDLILPRDARSVSASEARAPEFIDYLIAEQPARQTAMRGGLVWLDSECRRRFDKAFVDCTDAERRQVADDIAWPRKARPEMTHGVAFFTAMRDLVATGFWSSRIGVEDLGYAGNRPVADFVVPDEILRKLDVS